MCDEKIDALIAVAEAAKEVSYSYPDDSNGIHNRLTAALKALEGGE